VAKVKVKTEGNVINLMDALRQSLKGQGKAQDKAQDAPAAKAAPAKKGNGKTKKPAGSQREMLFALEGKGQKTAAKADAKRESAKRPARAPARQKRAG
jgi:DNA end-binding protein Ku